MDWIDRFNEAIYYIEEHLTEKIDYDKLGKMTGCSTSHFQRMFTYMTGIPLSEYIRRRRMSLAAIELQHKEIKIIDVAIKYGYSSPTAFNRAFQAIHGIAPSAVRNEGVSIKLYPPLKFIITVQGVKEMDYRIETREAFRVIGLPIQLEKNLELISSKWQEVADNGTFEKLTKFMNRQPMGMLGINIWQNNMPEKYYIAVSSSKESSEFEEYIVPAATWAIFSGKGTNQSIKELIRRIMTEWLPTSGYEHTDAPDIEVYLTPDPYNARYEMWIPVTKK